MRPRGLSDGEPDDVMVVVSSGCSNSAENFCRSAADDDRISKF